MDEIDVLVASIIAAVKEDGPDCRDRVRHLIDAAWLEMVMRLNGTIDSLAAQNRRLVERLRAKGR